MLIVPRAIHASVLKGMRRFCVSKHGRTVQYAGGGRIGFFKVWHWTMQLLSFHEGYLVRTWPLFSSVCP